MVTIWTGFEEAELVGTRPEVFQSIWDAATKITDVSIRFSTAISILEDLRPTDAEQSKAAVRYILDTSKLLPEAEEARMLFSLAWKLPELDLDAATNALDQLLKKYPFGKDYPRDIVIWTLIAEAFSTVDTDRALDAANRETDFLTRCRALIKIAQHTKSERAKEILARTKDFVNEQHPSFLVTQCFVELAEEQAKLDSNEATVLLKKALNYDMKDERLVDAWLLYSQITKVAATINKDMMMVAINRAVQAAEQMGNPDRAPHWLDASGTDSQFNFLLTIASSIRRFSPDLEISILKKACSAARDLSLEEFCVAVARIAKEAAEIAAVELPKDLLERAAQQLQKSDDDRKGSAYASCVVSLAVATAFADPENFDEMANNCLNYLSDLSTTTSFLCLHRLATEVLEAPGIDVTKIVRTTINTARLIDSRSDKATALAQSAELANGTLSKEECLALTTEAIETAIRIDRTSRRCITLLSIVAATKNFAHTHAKHAYEEAVHAALGLDSQNLRVLMHDFIAESPISLTAAAQIAEKLPTDSDRCNLLAQIAVKMRQLEEGGSVPK
jgi:hypothetical protein